MKKWCVSSVLIISIYSNFVFSAGATLPHEVLVNTYQKYISPITGPRSQFYPVSSRYMRHAIRLYGWKGVALGMDRLLRENGTRWIYPRIYLNNQWVLYDPPEWHCMLK